MDKSKLIVIDNILNFDKLKWLITYDLIDINETIEKDILINFVVGMMATFKREQPMIKVPFNYYRKNITGDTKLEEILTLLIKKGAKLNETNSEGWFILPYIIQLLAPNASSVVKLMIDNEIDIYNDLNFSIREACEGEDIETMKLLLKHKPNVTIDNNLSYAKYDFSALAIAISKNNINMAKLLINYIDDLDILDYTIYEQKFTNYFKLYEPMIVCEEIRKLLSERIKEIKRKESQLINLQIRKYDLDILKKSIADINSETDINSEEGKNNINLTISTLKILLKAITDN